MCLASKESPRYKCLTTLYTPIPQEEQRKAFSAAFSSSRSPEAFRPAFVLLKDDRPLNVWAIE